CQVIKHSCRNKIDGDRNQPSAHDVTADLRPTGEDDDSGYDFDDAHNMHEGGVLQWENACCDGTQVHLPVGKDVEVLVDAGEDGAHAQPNTERPPGGIQLRIRFFHCSSLQKDRA